MATMRVGDLAKATGISVRTLHHYDDIGLLRPSHRTAAGHRLYGERDVERLQQIVCLRDLGLALEEIRLSLDRDRATLQQILEGHRRALTQRIAAQQKMRRRIDGLLTLLRGGAAVPVDRMLKTIEEMTAMHEQYWTPEQMETFRKRAEALGEDGMQRAQLAWRELIAKVRECMERGDDPSSPHVRELARQWRDLGRAFSGGDPAVEATLRRMHEENHGKQQGDDGWFVDPALMDYVDRAHSST